MQFIQGQSLDQVLNELRQQVNRDSSEWEGEDEKALPSQPSRTGNVLAASLSQYDVAKRSNAACPKDSSSPTNSLSRRNYHRNVARIGLQIAEGLAYAEARNVVHRDIKPSNIMLDREGTAWITDFGLAKKATGMGQGDSESELTNEGDFLGTLRYLAPERLRGKHDAQGDIYGLGATLYELLTLTPIFDSHDRLSLMKDIADRAPVALKKREPYVPRDLETIVQKCLAKEPSGRYLSARQLADDLQLFLLDRPIRARRQNWMEKIVRWGRKNKLVASLVGTSFLLFIALILGVGVNRVLQKERDTAFAMLKRAESAESDAEARLLLKKVAAYRMSGSAGITQFLRPMEALPLDRLSAPVLEELRNEWASCLMKLDVIPGEPIEVKAQVACIDRQGERIAAISDGNQVSISDRVGPHRSSKQYSLGLEPTELRFSEAGDHLVASAMDFHQVLCVENGGKTFPAKPILACCCDVDGQNELTAFCRFDKSVEVFSIASEDFGKEHSSLKLDIQAKACRFSRDGRYIAVLGHDEDEVRLIDRTRGGRVSTVPGMSATAMAWSPDSRYLAIACEGRVIKTWDIETMSIIATLIGHQSQIVQIDWHPSKNLLQSRSWDNATILWNPTSAEQFLHFNSMSSSVEFSESNTIGWSRAGSCWTPLEMTEPFFRDTSVISNHTSGVVQFLVPETKDGIVGVVCSDQIQLYELATGRILQSLPAESTFSASFNEAQSELLTLQRDMIHRWRIKRTINRIGQRTWDLSLPEITPIQG